MYVTIKDYSIQFKSSSIVLGLSGIQPSVILRLPPATMNCDGESPENGQPGNLALHIFACEYLVTLGGRTLVWLANQQKTNALPTIGWPTYRLANHVIVSGWPSCGWPTINHTMVGQAMVGQPPTTPWLAN